MEQPRVTRRSFLKATSMTAAVAALGSVGMAGAKGLVPSDRQAQTSAVQVVKTACRACIHNCGVLASVQNGRVIKLEGNPEHRMSQGALCAKGLAGLQALYHPSRNKYPLKRAGQRGEGKWQRISWDEAIDTIARKLMETRDKYGAETVFASTGGGGNPQFRSIERFCNAFGTPNWVEPGCAQCYLPRTHYTAMVYGGSTSSIADSSVSEFYWQDDTPCKVAVLWGTVPAYDSPAGSGRAMAELRARGMRTIVIDPRLTPDAAKADIWLPIRPGTDVALMLAWTKYIIDNKLYDADFVMKWTNLPFLVNPATKLCLRESDVKAGGDPNTFVVWDKKSNSAKAMPFPWDDTLDPALTGAYTVNGIQVKTGFQLLVESVDGWTIEKAAEICWLEPSKVLQAVKLYATNTPGGIILGVATDQIVNAAQAAHGSLVLDLLLGNVEKPGAPLQRFMGSPIGGSVSALRALLPKEQFVKRLGLIEHKGLLSWQAGHIPTLLNAIKTGQPYKPRVWLERSGNKLAMLGNSSSWYPVLKDLDFIVHMFMYPTSFSAMADILLPATEWLETNLPVTICNQVWARQAVVHTWETLNETTFWSKLAKRCAELGHEGCQKAMDPKVVTAPEIPYWGDNEEDLLNAWTAPAKMTWKDLCQNQPYIIAPLDQYRRYYYYKQVDAKTGKPNGFNTPSKKLELYQERMVVLGRTGAPYSPVPLQPASKDYEPLPYYWEPAESPIATPDLAKQYPFTITSGRLPLYHHGTLRNIPWLRELYPVPELLIHPESAASVGVSDGDWVWIESQRGKIRAKAKITQGIAPKVLYLERFWYPEMPEKDPSLYGWDASSVNVLTKNDPPYNPEFGTYTLRGFLVKVSKAAEGAPAGVWQKPQDFTPWLPKPEGM